MEIEFLVDNEELIPQLANWYFAEWGHLAKGNSIQNVTDKLHGFLNNNKIPLIVVAMEKGEMLGASQLKFREMDIYPVKEHWLGGVFVAPEHRGNNIAEKLINKVVIMARKNSVKQLYLQTENLSGGLYNRLGWQPVEQVVYHALNVLVMQREI